MRFEIINENLASDLRKQCEDILANRNNIYWGYTSSGN
jgi:hypothetical protein